MTASANPSQLAAFAETARARARERRRALEARRQRGLALARRAAERLQTEYRARQVAVFGSVLKPQLFHERSDIDLAVWGLDEQLYLRALSALLDLEPDIAVDLVEFEHARPELQNVIEREGLAL